MPTDPFIPLTSIELSNGNAIVFSDGSVMLKKLAMVEGEEATFACEEQRFPLSKQDLEKLAKAMQLFAPHLSKENPL